MLTKEDKIDIYNRWMCLGQVVEDIAEELNLDETEVIDFILSDEFDNLTEADLSGG